MPKDVHMVNGLVLDPFSIHATGIMRAHSGVKTLSPHGGQNTKLFDGLHGEARFKQAFINCCHFAESMTVVGPVAQLVWNKDSSSVIENALRWQATMMNSNNGDTFRQFEEFCRNKNWTSIPDATCQDADAYLLNVMPDATLKAEDYVGEEAWLNYDGRRKLNRFLYNESGGMSSVSRDKVAGDHADTVVQRGLPVLGLLAVTFTFKKPTGLMSATELINLGSWPPVTFLIPTLVPALSSVEDRHPYDMQDKLCKRQPAISSYRITIGPNHSDNAISAFGQPYRLTSVPSAGKRPDILRSLSDVFKALWSQAAQYSAWNMSIPWQQSDENDQEVQKQLGDFCLDPLGAGRRIRGHNRHMSKYDVDNFSMVWEDNVLQGGDDHRVVGWNLHNLNKVAWLQQMRKAHSDKYENVFVLPSYFTEQTAENLYPVALGLARFGMVKDAGIEDFLAGGVVPSVSPANALEEDGQHGSRTESFVDLMTQAVSGNALEDDAGNRGAIPVHRVESEIAFDPDGDPTVFGLVINETANRLMRRHSTVPLSTDEQGELLKEVDRLGNFKFLDAICSKSTKDLTDTFKAVKAKGISTPGTKAAALLDEELAIDLFGSDSDGMLE